MSLFISNANAAAEGAPQSSGIELIFMLVIFGVIFYFMIFRPQSKRMKEQKNLMSSLQKGDEVMTSGGLIGRIMKVNQDNDFISIELNPDNQVVIKKDFVTAVLPKGTMKSL